MAMWADDTLRSSRSQSKGSVEAGSVSRSRKRESHMPGNGTRDTAAGCI